MSYMSRKRYIGRYILAYFTFHIMFLASWG